MQHSRAITKKSASNLALAFVLLPKQKRDAMSALYAFCRKVDDVADDETVPTEKRRAQLAEWRDDVKRACENQPPKFPVNRELQPVIKQFRLPFELFDELIKGCEMDLDTKRYENFEQLELYCHRVASVVGLLSIEIFGYKNPATRDYAIYLGKALQLTNILRDVKNDAARGRIYLPLDEMEKFNVGEDEILNFKYSENYRSLAASVAAQAKLFYQFARKTLPPEDRKSMVAAELMGSIYWRLLQKLEREEFNVFGGRMIRVSRPQKLLLIFCSWLRFISGSKRQIMERPDSLRRLIVNADDFGRSHSINEAVIRAHREGILTSASLMVNEVGFDEAVKLAKENPKLGVGLHLTLLMGHSALSPEKIPGLVNSRGEFSNSPVGAGMKYFWGARAPRAQSESPRFALSLREQLRAEIQAQFEKFHATGLPLDHVNGHLHLHLHPVIFKILMEDSEQLGIRHLRLTRDCLARSRRMTRGKLFTRIAHAAIFETLSRRARKILDAKKIRHAQITFGLLQDSRVDEEYILKLLPELPPGDSELYSHPSLGEFKHEFDALVSPRVKEQIKKLGIGLIRYQDL